MHDLFLSRREALLTLASVANLSLGVASVRGDAPVGSRVSDAEALALLDKFADNLLGLFPENATSLGVDKEARTGLRSQLTDRSPDGQRRITNVLRSDLERARAIDTAGLSRDLRISIEVVRSSYATALEGFSLPYGDVAVGGWRNTPYVVIQNVGAYLDIPRFLDSDHQIESAADAEAYLARLQSLAKQMDGELARLRAARAVGLIAPAFLIDKALGQMSVAFNSARQGGTLVESLERRTSQIPGR